MVIQRWVRCPIESKLCHRWVIEFVNSWQYLRCQRGVLLSERWLECLNVETKSVKVESIMDYVGVQLKIVDWSTVEWIVDESISQLNDIRGGLLNAIRRRRNNPNSVRVDDTCCLWFHPFILHPSVFELIRAVFSIHSFSVSVDAVPLRYSWLMTYRTCPPLWPQVGVQWTIYWCLCVV